VAQARRRIRDRIGRRLRTDAQQNAAANSPGRSGVSFLANAAWLVIATLAHNLLRWVAAIGLGSTGQVVAKTLRRRLLRLPGRLTRSARRRLLHLPCDWPWARQFLVALARLRAVPLRT
jgi:Transposase DDE domain group 1